MAKIESAQSGGSSGGSAPTQTCPNCQGEILTQAEGRASLNISQYLQRFGDIVVSILDTITGRPKKVSVKTALKECGACKGKSTLSDPTNDPAKNAQAGQAALAASSQIQQAESKMGPIGGNEYKIVSGSVLHEIGLGFNDTQAYEVHQDAAPRRWGIAGPGDKGADPQYSLRATKGGTTNLVVGKSVPSSPGGHYIIKCSNKFGILTGALGLDITTGGPVNINGGITKITGPQVTIGASSAGGSGGLALEGDVITGTAKSVEWALQGDGHHLVVGSSSTTGNHTVGGMVYGENGAFVKLATTSKNEQSKISSTSNIYGGPSFWGGQNTKCTEAALKELLAFVTVNTTDPSHVAEVGPTSTRYTNTLKDNMSNVAYSARPVELCQTGYALLGEVQIPVYNFPHIHAVHDQTHKHSYKGLNADLYDDDKQLRAACAGVDSHAPYQSKSDASKGVIAKIFDPISKAFVVAGQKLLQDTFNV